MIFFRVGRSQRRFAGYVVLLIALLALPRIARASWAEPQWSYRRALTVTWDAEHASGNDLATAEFYTDGHLAPGGGDLRVTTADGDAMACHVLMLGPGDRVRIVFALKKQVRNYDVYFGNPAAPPAPANLADVRYRAGLRMETRLWNGGRVDSFGDMERTWDESRPILGTAMIDAASLGYNPFGDQDRTISKITGTFNAPLPGTYLFALSVDDKGALFIDDRPLLRADLGPGDTRYHAAMALSPGSHDLLLYHVNTGGEGRFTVGWRRPDSAVYQVMGRGAFGTCFGAVAGPLEQQEHSLLADFAVQQVGECFIDNQSGYAFCYRFTSNAHAADAIGYRWDFGDGQSTQGDAAAVDHVYLRGGVYPVKLAIAVGPNGDVQTSRVAVERNYLHLINAVEVEPGLLCKLINGDRPAAMSSDDLARAVQIYLNAGDLDGALRAANALASSPVHDDPNSDVEVMAKVSSQLLDRGRVDDAVGIWGRVGDRGRMGVVAAAAGAKVALWWQGDAAGALRWLGKAPSGAPDVQGLYAEALVLDGKAQEGGAILRRLESHDEPARRMALAGAAARSVEFYITEGDSGAGEAAWERWMQRFPADFLEGYSMLLRVKLMELRHREPAAAALAEGFALAEPQSSYAPQLLDLASKLLASSNPSKSQSLRALLKQKYPEDPLSQG